MNILVFGGSGKIGTAVAWDLVKADDVEAVGLIGSHWSIIHWQRKDTW